MVSEKQFDPTISEWAYEYANFQAYEYLDGDIEEREKTKVAFLQGEIENPMLDYPKLNLDELEKKERELLAFRELIKKELLLYIEEFPDVDSDTFESQQIALRRAYIFKLNEKIAEVRMLKISARMNEMISEGDSERSQQEKLMNHFMRYSIFIYGKPSLDIFRFTLSSIKSEIESGLNSSNQETVEVANLLFKSINFPDIAPLISNPSEELFRNAAEVTEKELGDLINIENISKSTGITSLEAQNIFMEALNKLNAYGWNVIIDEQSSRKAIHVSQEDMQVVIPAGREFSINQIKSLIFHEIGTHVARRLNGERSKLRLLGIGLDRYKDDEGIATMREQVLKPEFGSYAGLDGHLAISLACGLDGIKRNFRQVFEILFLYYKLRDLNKSPNVQNDKINDIEKKAKESAYSRCIRTFRGTDCRIPGVCFTKDIFYREGNIEVWAIMNSDPERSTKFNLGKYDPANPNHLAILSELGILDDELDSIESEGRNP